MRRELQVRVPEDAEVGEELVVSVAGGGRAIVKVPPGYQGKMLTVREDPKNPWSVPKGKPKPRRESSAPNKEVSNPRKNDRSRDAAPKANPSNPKRGSMANSNGARPPPRQNSKNSSQGRKERIDVEVHHLLMDKSTASHMMVSTMTRAYNIDRTRYMLWKWRAAATLASNDDMLMVMQGARSIHSILQRWIQTSQFNLKSAFSSWNGWAKTEQWKDVAMQSTAAAEDIHAKSRVDDAAYRQVIGELDAKVLAMQESLDDASKQKRVMKADMEKRNDEIFKLKSSIKSKNVASATQQSKDRKDLKKAQEELKAARKSEMDLSRQVGALEGKTVALKTELELAQTRVLELQQSRDTNMTELAVARRMADIQSQLRMSEKGAAAVDSPTNQTEPGTLSESSITMAQAQDLANAALLSESVYEELPGEDEGSKENITSSQLVPKPNGRAPRGRSPNHVSRLPAPKKVTRKSSGRAPGR